MDNEKHTTLGTEEARWDLSFLYSGLDDPRIDADVEESAAASLRFRETFRGALKDRLGDAIDAYIALNQLGSRYGCYLFCRMSLNPMDETVMARKSAISERLDVPMSENLSFFAIELCALPDADIERLCAEDPRVAKHRPWIDHVRRYKDHMLSEEVETALSKYASFGPNAWHEFFDTMEAMLSFTHRGEKKNLEQMLEIGNESQDPAERAEAYKTVNDGLKGWYAAYSAQTLYVTAGDKRVEDRDRKYAGPMSSRNLDNSLPDAVVDALHAAVRDVAGPICRDWYRMKGEMLGIRPLRWSDRNAKLPFVEEAALPYAEAVKMVVDAYRSFSPTLAGLVEGMFRDKRIDAHVVQPRSGGGWNMSFTLPEGPRSLIFMNYLGSRRDAMTLAHELGHAVHGLLAGEAQGALMQDAPMAYAETASIFGEMTVFNAEMARLTAAGDVKTALALVASKTDDLMNSVVRQISFSEFEQTLHKTPKRLTVEELCAEWMRVTRLFYGEDGEAFAYGDMEHLWSYISHFHRPFYVYAYAAGELFTQSLYATKDRFGKDFEPMYLDLLRAGGTKDAFQLLKPFGLDPADPAFWADGIRNSIGRMVKEAQRLHQEWLHGNHVDM